MRRRRQSAVSIVFETHSTSTDNERWLASGWRDCALSAAGRRQARELGQRRAEDEPEGGARKADNRAVQDKYPPDLARLRPERPQYGYLLSFFEYRTLQRM